MKMFNHCDNKISSEHNPMQSHACSCNNLSCLPSFDIIFEYIHTYIYIYIYIYTYIKYYIKQIKIFPSFNLLQAPERHCCLYEAMDPSNELQL